MCYNMSMWIFTNKGFLSIIQDWDNPGVMIIRARFPGHIKALFPDAKVKKTPERDYRYRAFIPREEVAERVKNLAEDIDYSNFKDSVRDPEYHHACTGVWSVMYRAQR